MNQHDKENIPNIMNEDIQIVAKCQKHHNYKKYDDISLLREDLESILGYSQDDEPDEKSLLFNLIKIKNKNETVK